MSKKPTPKKKQCLSSTRSRYASFVRKVRERLKRKYAIDTCLETGEKKWRFFASENGRYRGKQIFTSKKGTANAPKQEIEA